MRKRLLMILLALTLVLTFSGMGSAGEVSIDKARIVAENWLYYCVQTYGPWAGTNSPSISDEEEVMYKDQVVGFNFLVDPKGHILVSSRDDLPPVKLYSDTSTLSIYAEDQEQIDWIAEETFGIGQAIDEHSGELATMDASQNPDVQAWARFGNPDFEQEFVSTAEETDALQYGPLLSSTWGQGDPYNLQCPLDPWNSYCRTIVGCVATAAAQIMRYWGYPATGTGSTSYTWHGMTLSRNFASSTYDWANMPNNLTSGSSSTQKNAVAKLCADVGVAFHMDYGCDGSSAYTDWAPGVFKNYFRYKNTATWVNRSSYSSQSAWMQVFRTETQNGRPSQLRIRDDICNPTPPYYCGGHSVVVDGYRDSPSESVHINMGWYGSYDGWYTPDSFTTGNYTWALTNYQGAAIRIEPDIPTGARDEIIGTWNNGIWYFYPPYWYSGQTRMYADTPDGASPSGDIEAGDTNGDGVADVASCWSTGLKVQNGSTRAWETVYPIAPYKVTMANVYGDARKEVIGTYVNGVFYFYRTSSGWSWRLITAYPPAGDMAAGDMTGDGWDEVVSGYSTGTWIWNPITGGWKQLTTATYIPYNLACGDGNGDGRAEVVGGYNTGVWTWSFDRPYWVRLTSSGYATTGDLAMGDFNKNGRDDLVSCWPGAMWIRYDNGSWYQAYGIPPYRVTAGQLIGD